MANCLDQYDFFDEADPDKNRYILENKSSQEIMTEWLKIAKRVKDNPNKKYFIFCLFAGHGMIHNNEQVLLCKDFKEYKEDKMAEEIKTNATDPSAGNPPPVNS